MPIQQVVGGQNPFGSTVDLSEMGTIADGSIVGNNSGGVSVPLALTATQTRTLLGLGSAALLTAGTSANNAVQLDGTAKLPAVDGSALTNLPASGLSAASQAQMEAATDNTVAVTPGRQQYHPGTCKAWAHFNGTGTAALVVSHNVTSLTDNGTGDQTLNFTTSFSTANYAALVSGNYQETGTTSIDGGQASVSARATPRAVGSCRLATTVNGIGTSSLTDFVSVYAAFFGDQ